MDVDRKINLGEGVPLNSPGANIFLNTGKNKKVNDGTVIHLNTEKPTDVGVHINTTFSIASSKKIKFIFFLNFVLTVICMILTCTMGFYFWNEVISMRRQVDGLKEQLLILNVKEEAQANQLKAVSSPLMSNLKPVPMKGHETRESRMGFDSRDMSANAKKYYVENLGEDMLLVDSSKKNPSNDKLPTYDLSMFKKEPLVAHFNGAMRELNLGDQSFIGPWVRDVEVSTKGSELQIDINANYFTIKESGLYLVYAQVVYLTHAPNCYFIWARQQSHDPRLITSCATGDDSSSRPLNKSQISCSVQTVTRLSKGDTVNVAQREQNRTLWLRPGYSYIGFIKLSS